MQYVQWCSAPEPKNKCSPIILANLCRYAKNQVKYLNIIFFIDNKRLIYLSVCALLWAAGEISGREPGGWKGRLRFSVVLFGEKF